MLGVTETVETALCLNDLAMYPPWISATSWSRNGVIRLLEFSIPNNAGLVTMLEGRTVFMVYQPTVRTVEEVHGAMMYT